MSIAWFDKPTTLSSRSALAAGLSSGFRLCSSMIRNTSSSGRLSASACVQPVSVSATLLS